MGVELGQLLVLLVMLPVLAFAFRWLVDERVGTIILSALVAHTAWHWLVERWDVLSMYPLAWPVVDAAFMASLLRWAMLGVLAVLAAWIVRAAGGRRVETAVALAPARPLRAPASDA